MLFNLFSPKIKIISKDELNKKIRMNDKFILIDVCEAFEYEIRKIEGAVNIPLAELSENFQQIFENLDKNIEIIIYCAHGIRSKRAVSILKNFGYENVYSLEGGIANFLDMEY